MFLYSAQLHVAQNPETCSATHFLTPAQWPLLFVGTVELHEKHSLSFKQAGYKNIQFLSWYFKNVVISIIFILFFSLYSFYILKPFFKISHFHQSFIVQWEGIYTPPPAKSQPNCIASKLLKKDEFLEKDFLLFLLPPAIPYSSKEPLVWARGPFQTRCHVVQRAGTRRKNQQTSLPSSTSRCSIYRVSFAHPRVCGCQDSAGKPFSKEKVEWESSVQSQEV